MGRSAGRKKAVLEPIPNGSSDDAPVVVVIGSKKARIE